MGGQVGQGNVDPFYELPIEVKVLSALKDPDSNLIFDVALRNIGKTDFDLPSSKKLASVVKPGNKSQRVFFFSIKTLPGNRHEPGKDKSLDIGAAATAGSSSMPNSFIRMPPGKVVRVLLLAPHGTVHRAFSERAEPLEAFVACNEWQLADDRYFLRASSHEARSPNTIKFVLREGKPTVLEPSQ